MARRDDTHIEKTIGPIIGSLIIVLLLMLGALYIWAQKLKMDREQETMQRNSINSSQSAELHTGDDINSLKKDLNATDVEKLDRSLRALQ